VPRTDAGAPPEWLGLRHRRIIGWVAFGGAVTGGLAGVTVTCFVLGARLWAAGFALATLAAAPLLAVGPVLDWWWHRRPLRRRHRVRSERFPGVGRALPRRRG
jgi:hypothetical protein